MRNLRQPLCAGAGRFPRFGAIAERSRHRSVRFRKVRVPFLRSRSGRGRQSVAKRGVAGCPSPGHRPVLRPGPDRKSSRIRLALVLPGVLGDTDPPFGQVPPADLRPLSGGDVGRERADSSVLTIRGCPTSRRHPLSKHFCPDPIPEYAVLGEAEKLARHSHSRIRGTPDNLRVSALREQVLCASGGGFAPGGRYL